MQRSPIKAILFDKDGTLIDFRTTWLPAYFGATQDLADRVGGGLWLAQELLRRHGYDPTTDQFTAESPLLWATTHQLAALWAAEPELAPLRDVAARIERHFSDHVAYPPVPVTDLRALFARLTDRGLRLGVVSMDSTAAAEATLERFAIRDYLGFVAGDDAGFGLKPEAGMVFGFCRAVGLEPREVAVVGDHLADLAMARAAGAGLAVAVLTGGCPAAALSAQADLVLASITGLEAALDSYLTAEPSATCGPAAPSRS